MPRISINVSEKDFEALNKLLPWGTKNQFMRYLISDIIEISKRKGGEFIISGLFHRHIRLNDLPAIGGKDSVSSE